MKPFFGLRGKQLNYAIGIIAGCDFLLFGYGNGSSSSTTCLALTQKQTKASWEAS